jgi:FMN phosphatase YigB (HAD superfamily)
MAGRTLIFDLDDTLVQTNYKYRISIGHAYAVVAEAIVANSPDLCPFVNVLRDVWKEVLKKTKYTKMLWPETLKMTYRYFCDENWVKADAAVESRLHDIAMKVFEDDFPDTRGTDEVTRFLKERGDTLILITCGEEKTQFPKLRGKPWVDRFDPIYYELEGKEGRYEALKKELDPLKTFGVGDSLERDAEPFKGLGRFLLLDPGPFDVVDLSSMELEPYIRLIKGLPDIIRDYKRLERADYWG